MLPFTLFHWLLLLTALLCLLLCWPAWRQRHLPVAPWFAALNLSFAVYALGYALELTSVNEAQVEMWLKLEFVGASFLPSCLLLMAVSYQRQRHPPLLLQLCLLGIACLILAIQLGNHLHHWSFSQISLRQVAGLAIASLTFGPWYYVYSVYTNLAVLLSNLVFLHIWLTRPAELRPQAGLILLGSLVPWFCYGLFLTDSMPYGLDLTCFGFLPTALAFALGLFRYHFVNLPPIAREQVFNQVSDALLVTDSRFRLVDFNPQASQLLSTLSRMRPGDDTRPLLAALGVREAEQPPLTPLPMGSGWLELRRHPLGGSEPPQGYLWQLRDVTERESLLAQLRQQAQQDPVTGLPNRWCLEAELEQRLQGSQPLSLVLLDLVALRQLKERQGPEVARQRQRQLVGLLQGQLPAGALLGHYGGDELLALLPLPLDEAQGLARRWQQQVQLQVGLPLQQACLTGGTAASPRQLLRRLEQALQQQKALARRATAGNGSVARHTPA